MAVKRTTHRSSRGKPMYAVRMPDGSLEPIQTYARRGAPGERVRDPEAPVGATPLPENHLAGSLKIRQSA